MVFGMVLWRAALALEGAWQHKKSMLLLNAGQCGGLPTGGRVGRKAEFVVIGFG